MYEIIVSSLLGQQQVAITNNQRLIHFYSEVLSEKSIVGNIYLGTVMRVLPGMECAFIEIGLSRTAFLHFKDIQITGPEIDSITKILHQGQRLLVQVIKDPISDKGARLTTEISIASTHLVYKPYQLNNGISQKIQDEDERARLVRILENLPLKGLLARTVAEYQSEESFLSDCLYLKNCWQKVQEGMIEVKNSSALLLEELELPLRVLRDFAKNKIDKIFVDSDLLKNNIENFLKKFIENKDHQVDNLVELVESPVFSKYDILSQLKSSLSKEIDLKSGGSVIIEETESMTTIDINTGSFVGKKNHEQTVLKTNLEAVDIIANQIILRNLGGLIIIDFIDMKSKENQELVLNKLKEKMKIDSMPICILPFSEVGLVQMTRKRTSESNQKQFYEKCPCCHGLGSIKNNHTLSVEIATKILNMIKKNPGKKITVVAHEKLSFFLKNNIKFLDQELAKYESELILKVDMDLSPGDYEIIPGAI